MRRSRPIAGQTGREVGPVRAEKCEAGGAAEELLGASRSQLGPDRIAQPRQVFSGPKQRQAAGRDNRPEAAAGVGRGAAVASEERGEV